METKSLLQKSKKFKQEAETILRQSKLIEFLSPLGQLKLTGSYKLDLMSNGDIDINIINPKFTKRRVVKILNQLIVKSFFKSYHFYDFIKFQQAELPRGYYIGLRKYIKGRKWNIDLWFLTKDDPNEVKTMKLVEENLTGKTKLIILKLKHYRNHKNLDVSSAMIYKAVLIHNIASIQKFTKFLTGQI